MALDICEIRLEKLPERFVGYRIAHISDIHIGTAGEKLVGPCLRTLSDQRIDLVAMTGDILNSPRFVHLAKPVLEEIVETLTPVDGFAAILGNHDDRDLILKLLRD